MQKVFVIGSVITTVAAIFCLSFWLTGLTDKNNFTKAEAKKTSEQEYLSQIGYDDDSYQLNIGRDMSHSDLISIMHKMTHSKMDIKNEKLDFIEPVEEDSIPITNQTISTLKEHVERRDGTMKSEMLAIIDKWEKGYLGSIQQDHDWCIAMLEM